MSAKKNLYGFKEVLYEYTTKGNYIAVCALDPITRMEATVIAPYETALPILQNLSTRKLRMVVDKKLNNNKPKNASTSTSQNQYGKQQNISGWDL